MRILLLEDNPGDVALAKVHLRGLELDHQLTAHQTLAAGLEAMRAEPPDVILLDLGLPDSQGLPTLERVREASREVPVVVLSASEQEGLACVRAGAQDFLPKSELSSAVLARAMLFAIERLRLQQRLQPSSDEVRQRLEQAGLDLEQVAHGLSVCSRDPSAPSLSESSPQVFEELGGRYAELLRGSLKPGAGELSAIEARYALADQLAYLAGKPKDVLELHRRALHQVAAELSAVEQRGLARAGPELLTELLCHLIGAYRQHSLAHRRSS